MMGNENSQLSGLDINSKAIEVTDGWTLHSATLSSGNIPTVSVFISGPIHGADNMTLEQSSKNLMVHRHPRILKFVSSWKKNGKFYLATEEVVPLSHVLNQLTPLQICIGLHSILKALIFLHEKAFSSHNNVSCAAIYVTPDGTWKLGGLEYLCPFSKLTHKYLEQAKGRYQKAVPPEVGKGKLNTCVIDAFGFGVLSEEVLCGQDDDCVPALAEFRNMCRMSLQNNEPTQRPPLSELTSHPFLTHDFITIHSFLLELPLKLETEKQTFFRSLTDELARFPEELVASQLGGLLLSRLVLLDQTAQEFLLPKVLSPRTDDMSMGLFSLAVYRQHLVPRLLQIMCVRDAQIRLLLLGHCAALCQAFTSDQLRMLVLPELLVGIKDTNDHLVSVTLHVLADLVPLLGAATVIGGKRGKLFTDGRPKAHGIAKRKSPLHSPQQAANAAPTFLQANLPERPSPDGGEDKSQTTDEETEAWSDWDVPVSNTVLSDNELDPDHASALNNADLESTDTVLAEVRSSNQNVLPDITTLDIKHLVETSSRHKDEIDFFEDMVPVISKTHFTRVEEKELPLLKDVPASNKGRFDVAIEEEVEGWGDEIDDWGESETTGS